MVKVQEIKQTEKTNITFKYFYDIIALKHERRPPQLSINTPQVIKTHVHNVLSPILIFFFHFEYLRSKSSCLLCQCCSKYR